VHQMNKNSNYATLFISYSDSVLYNPMYKLPNQHLHNSTVMSSILITRTLLTARFYNLGTKINIRSQTKEFHVGAQHIKYDITNNLNSLSTSRLNHFHIAQFGMLHVSIGTRLLVIKKILH
jgi:hypothetical protein